MANKKIHIIGGGTVAHIRNHLALSAPAYGKTARRIAGLCFHSQDNRTERNDTNPIDEVRGYSNKLDVHLHLTKMALRDAPFSTIDDYVDRYWPDPLETNYDIGQLIDKIVADKSTKIVFFNPALVDFEPKQILVNDPEFGLCGAVGGTDLGKYSPRLKTSENPELLVRFVPSDKLVSKIRAKRKDIFLVAFKTTCGATEDEQYIAGLNLLKGASCNLVLANDTKTRVNMIITPEEARYHVTRDREEALKNLVQMALLRSHLTFTRSTVVDGEPVAWSDERVPASLRTVVNAMIDAGAYKPFRGATVGHFAAQLDETTFLTSKRKTNFNDIDKNGLVLVKTDGPDTVIAYGAKPSVGGQSQRKIFAKLPGFDCIVHFHCPLKEDAPDRNIIPVRSQREYECGSHECGENTAAGLNRIVIGLGANGDEEHAYVVHLDQHGPNIVFPRNITPDNVINFIKMNWDLAGKTGGYVNLPVEV